MPDAFVFPEQGDTSGTRSDGRVKLLEACIASGITEFRDKQATSKWRTYLFRLSIIMLGGLTTVILGTKPFAIQAGYGNEATLSALALVVSALVTALSAIDGLAQPGLKWIDSRNMVGGFLQIREDLEFRLRCADPMSDKELGDFYDRVTALRRGYDLGWAQNRALAIHGGGGKRA